MSNPDVSEELTQIIVSKLNPAWFDCGDGEAISLAEEILTAIAPRYHRGSETDKGRIGSCLKVLPRESKPHCCATANGRLLITND